MSYYGHSRNPGYISGQYWVVCQRCGFEIKNIYAKRQWDNLIVCPPCFDIRNPQDLIKTRTNPGTKLEFRTGPSVVIDLPLAGSSLRFDLVKNSQYLSLF